MKTNRIFHLAIPLLFSVYFYACDAGGYQIIEIPIDSSQYPTANNDVISPDTQQGPEIQTQTAGNNITSEAIPIDSKVIQSSSGSNLPEKVLTIQLGAFASESSAKTFSDNAAGTLGINVNYEKINGLYKVRAGTFNSLSDALTALDRVKSSGFKDGFIIEKGN